MTRRDSLLRALERAAHDLPAQAPLDVFVHHNPLHAYQHLPFHDAIAAAARKVGARGYLPIPEYRAALARGRIRIEDLDASIAEAELDVAESGIAGIPSSRALLRSVLIHDVRAISDDALDWEMSERAADRAFARDVSDVARARILATTVAWLDGELRRDADPAELATWIVGSDGETPSATEIEGRLREALDIPLRADALRRALVDRPDAIAVRALWTACERGCRDRAAIPRCARSGPTSFRDLFVSRGAEDPAELVASALVPVCAAFLDRGQSHWSMPDRERGFFEAWSRMSTAGWAVRPAWLADLGARLRAWRGIDPCDVALSLLDELGIAEGELDAFVGATLLALPGWAGMFHRLETAPAPIGRSAARATLLDYFVVRLVLDAQAYRDLARGAGYRGPLSGLREFLRARPALGAARAERIGAAAWPVFVLAQHAGISAPALWRAGGEGAAYLHDLIATIDEGVRARIWHESYERRYREELLGALASSAPLASPVAAKTVQVVFCLDDRGESLRRHFEELSPRHETFGAAGFFELAIAYQGIDDPTTFPLCPVIVDPRHRITEQPADGHIRLAETRRRRRRRLGRLDEMLERASRSIVWGPLATALVGAWTALPLLVEVFAPRVAERVRRAATRWLIPALRTELAVPRSTPDEGAATSALIAGFSIEEKAARVARLLENIGLTDRFAPVVAIVGHDSSSVNNPHFAAYSCGACGGRSGGPNARLFARMANRADVRELLRARGISIPATTIFVGGVHDTCADTIRFYDLRSADDDHAARIAALGTELERALARNAHERCRRLESAPRTALASRARTHVETRSVDLSQPRPELGHATNAACVVGRRALTEGLFLDRRVFLASYDAARDPTGEILERILLAVGPVCAGINLEYFFSTTDAERFGAGTKLPHNVTALLGVMNGACSDLRTGLPRQMTEIHEPIRLQLVVEADEAILRRVLARQPSLRELVENEWLRLVVRDPASCAMSIVGRGGRPVAWNGSARLPIVPSSAAWYSGDAGFMPAARVDRVREPAATLGWRTP